MFEMLGLAQLPLCPHGVDSPNGMLCAAAALED
jgi:hypothetical protein